MVSSPKHTFEVLFLLVCSVHVHRFYLLCLKKSKIGSVFQKKKLKEKEKLPSEKSTKKENEKKKEKKKSEKENERRRDLAVYPPLE